MRFLDKAEREALDYLMAHATDGPWHVGLEQDGILAGYPTVVRHGSAGVRIVNVDMTRPFVGGKDYEEAVANVIFIATARDALPRLMAENRYLRNLMRLSPVGGNHDGAE